MLSSLRRNDTGTTTNDQVGHTGVYDAAVEAIGATDKAVKTVYDACEEAGYVLCVTADHGNAEQMLDPHTGNPHTAHTTSTSHGRCGEFEMLMADPVPFIVTGDKGALEVSSEAGALADVAPTVLAILGLPQPEGTPDCRMIVRILMMQR